MVTYILMGTIITINIKYYYCSNTKCIRAFYFLKDM